MIEPLSCSLVGQQDVIAFAGGSLVERLYGAGSATEEFFCSYGLNETYDAAFEEHGLRITGRGPAGEGRVAELDGHPFFMGTLFLPQARSSVAEPHPVLVGFAAAARG